MGIVHRILLCIWQRHPAGMVRVAERSLTGVPAGPASNTPATAVIQPSDQKPTEIVADPHHVGTAQKEGCIGHEESADEKKDKFFVVKSLTVEDLESSVKNGIWTTQAHNEVALNKAFAVGFGTGLLNYPLICYCSRPTTST